MKTNTELRSLMNLLIREVLPSAVCRGCFIVNDIPAGTYITAEKELVALILIKLLDNTVSSSQDSCIRITAVQEDDSITVSVKDNHSDYSRYISGKMIKVKPLLKQVGGEINFEFNRRNSITILLSFQAPVKAA